MRHAVWLLILPLFAVVALKAAPPEATPEAPSETPFRETTFKASVETKAPAVVSPQMAPTAPQPTAAAKPAARRTWDRYEVVVQRNIFLRNPASNSSGTRGGDPFRRLPRRSTGESWTLTGIVLSESAPVAFIENNQTATTLRIHAGEDTPAGRVARIEAEHLEMVSAEGTYLVGIGMRLNGEPAAGAPAAPSSAEPAGPTAAPPASTAETASPLPTPPAAVQTPPAPASSGEASEASVLERLRARRQQQINR